VGNGCADLKGEKNRDGKERRVKVRPSQNDRPRENVVHSLQEEGARAR